MRRPILTIAFVLICLNAFSISIVFSPPQIEVNQLSTFSFDPISPDEQPILTNVSITNDNTAQQIMLQVEVLWNGQTIIGEGMAVFRSRMMEPGETLFLTNRDLITEQAGDNFSVVNNDINIMDVVESFPTLEDAVLAGYFPDGSLQLLISVKADGAPDWQESSTFTIRIRNVGGIYLSSPGALIGQRVPELNHLPVSFIWNAVNTGFNPQKLVIREYPPNTPPRLSNILGTGTEIYHTPEGLDESSGFSEYLPFNSGYYYAWQVYTTLFDENNPSQGRADKQLKKQESSWFVFRYVMDEGGDVTAEDLQLVLNMLEDPALSNIMNLGYTPTGAVIFEGRTYTGQEALDILSSLVGKDLTVEIKD
jgi:hypothetical protein